jgi:transposase
VCNTTVLRDIHRTTLPEHKNVRRIGVDDWAFRKGVDYGSIIIDLDTGHAIDLLGDREHDSFKSWMDEHADVKLVSRDRSTEYSAAIASTGRKICEVADLFHLVKNMSECITRVISDNYHSYREMVTAKPEPVTEPPSVKKEAAAEPQIKEDSRMAMFREVKRLQALGKKPAWIARNMKIAHQTATKYCAIDILPKRKSKCRNEYHKYDAYVECEYAKGKNLTEIYQEIKHMGFKGSMSPYHYHYHYLSDGHRGYRSKKQKEEMAQKAIPMLKAEPVLPIKTLSMIVDREIRSKEHNNEQESAVVSKMFALSWFHEMYVAAKTYYAIMKGKDSRCLEMWVAKYKESTVKQIRTLALGISIDFKAVSKAVTTNIRNGITEGFVNKLKEVKRTMYGRAKLELLKRKMMLGYYIFN